MTPPAARPALLRDRLALPESVEPLLRWLHALDTDPEFAQSVRESDPYARSGVLGWSFVAHAYAELGVDEITAAAAVRALAAWGLVEIVGLQPQDVRTGGSVPVRPTPALRQCLGLGPATPAADPPGEARAWEVAHGGSREALLGTAFAALGTPVAPIRLPPEPERLDHTMGEVAVALFTAGHAVVDATRLEAGALDVPVDALLRRTPTARGARWLLLQDPTAARPAAATTGARLRWVPPTADARGFDPRIGAALAARDPEATRADLCGVPAAHLARPRLVQVDWRDLDLPESTSRRLELAILHVQARVDGAIGPQSRHARGGGYRLLLSGLPGTGKSLTAAALASALARPLVRLDLSSILSKWLGETEKILGEVFDLAEASGTVLVLDEADSLFRQRESSSQGGGGGLATCVAYLLSRLDDFSGVLVATTNRAEDLDEAFFRRFDDYLVLPMPDTATRARLWTRMLGPDAVDVDVTHLAERFSLSGGVIEGAAIRSRAWARGIGRPLDTSLVLASLGLELEKNQRSIREIGSSPYAEAARRWLESSR